MELNYKVYGDIGEDVIILHGLLGSLDNWQTIAKALSETYRVWVIDQRNHGRSPHSDQMSYDVLAADLLEFMARHDMEHAHIVGHSMGGKVAMAFALEHGDKTGQLIVVDIAPVWYEGDHIPILEAMMAVPLKDMTERSQVETFLEGRIRSTAVRQLMLKNLGRDQDGFFWKPDVQVLFREYRKLMDFDTHGKTFSGKTSFIRGEKSDYIHPADFSAYQAIFPAAQLYTIPDAGHWIHADQPQAFLKLLQELLDGVV